MTDARQILIAGGAGFVGSHLVHHLLDEGHQVYVVDNFSTGKRVNVERFSDYSNYNFYEMDIVSSQFLDTFLEIPLDAIYNLACPTGVPNIQPMAEEMLMTCSLGALNVLNLAKYKNIPVLLTSTAEIYGDPEVDEIPEDYTGNVNPVGLRSPYEEGKRFAEALFAMYARTHGVTAKIVRLFNTYGDYMSLEDKRVISAFARAIKDGEPITIYGDGSQTRTFLYAHDAVAGIRQVMEHGSPAEPYNVGGDKEVTIKEFAELFVTLTNHEVGITYVPHFIEDHKKRKPAVEKLKRLGWSQTIPYEAGVRKFLAAHNITVHN